MTFSKLFERGRIGSLTLKNRAVMVPMGTDFANHDGTPSPRLIRYYEERARGGVALIITEYTGVDDEDSVPTNYNLRLARDWHIAGAEQLVEAVHRHDALIFAQLHHAGSTSKPALSGRQSLSASDVPAVPGGPVPRPMSLDEIALVQSKFIEAAVRAKKAGYDGIELHGAHSYLIGQFFSPYYNKREDDYGGDLTGRMRFIDEIIDGIRAKLGSYPISVRICGDEMTRDVPGSLTLEDGLAIGLHLQEKGIDVLNVSNGSALNGNANCDPYSYRPGWKKYVALAFKERLSLPIIATNTIKNPEFAERLLSEGVCDFVGLGRSQLADPDFVRKASRGETKSIRPCIGCMVCRERLLVHQNSIACAVNARTGREYAYGTTVKDGDGRSVAVIGGGPAGMESARLLAERGFKVSLFEKENLLGGTLNLADKAPHKELIGDFNKSMQAQLQALDVEVHLGIEATPELVRRACNPVGVLVATGAKPLQPPLPGLDSAHVMSAESVIRGESEPRGRVAIIGTGLTGLETAEILGEQGYSLTLVEMQESVGPGIFGVILNDILGRIKKYEPTILAGHRLLGLNGSYVSLLKSEDGTLVSIEADSVVLALGVRPRTPLVESFERAFPNVRAVGDAAAGGRICEAIRSGYEAALVFAA